MSAGRYCDDPERPVTTRARLQAGRDERLGRVGRIEARRRQLVVVALLGDLERREHREDDVTALARLDAPGTEGPAVARDVDQELHRFAEATGAEEQRLQRVGMQLAPHAQM